MQSVYRESETAIYTISTYSVEIQIISYLDKKKFLNNPLVLKYYRISLPFLLLPIECLLKHDVLYKSQCLIVFKAASIGLPSSLSVTSQNVAQVPPVR